MAEDLVAPNLSQEELSSYIKLSAQKLGSSMDSALPRKNYPWRSRIAGKWAESEKALIPGEVNPSTITRAWLCRPMAPVYSGDAFPVVLMKDTVSLGYSRAKDQGRQTASKAVDVASFDQKDELELMGHELGASQTETLARLKELGKWVTMIVQANTDAELRQLPTI